MTRKYEELVRKLRDKVECPVCFDVPKSAPVPVCPNGHVVCVKCVREVCPTCRVRMEHGTSTLAVTVIENIEHTCEHEDCGQSLPHSEIKSKNNFYFTENISMLNFPALRTHGCVFHEASQLPWTGLWTEDGSPGAADSHDRLLCGAGGDQVLLSPSQVHLHDERGRQQPGD